MVDGASISLQERNNLQNCISLTEPQPMKELVQVFKILNVCADRVDSQPLYEQPIIDILRLCSLPYLKEKSSDELIYEQIVVESVSQLGEFYFRCVYCVCERERG